MSRKRIPQPVETAVLTDSRRRCCICSALNFDSTQKQGQITHLDRDPSNNKPDNLVFLCLDHHDQYDTRTSQSKNLTITEVKNYRSQLYEYLRSESKMKSREGTDDMPQQLGVITIGIIQNSRRTFFYVPDQTENRYNDPSKNPSYSIFSFEFDIKCNSKITIHEIKAKVFHPHVQLGRSHPHDSSWVDIDDCEKVFVFSDLYETAEYLEGFKRNCQRFEGITIDIDQSVILRIRKCGQHALSLVHGMNSYLYVAFIFHINTSFLFLLCQVPELSSGYPAIFSYKLSETYDRRDLITWANDIIENVKTDRIFGKRKIQVQETIQ